MEKNRKDRRNLLQLLRKISEVSESDKVRLWAPARKAKLKTVLIWVPADDGYVTKVYAQIGQKVSADKHW
jgi:multidrug resistance efflux pump